MIHAMRPEPLDRLLAWTAAREPGKDAMRRRFTRLLRGAPVPPHVVKVTGTNGKGSVCAMLEACLRREGLSTGTFTSPHLVRVEERFRIDGRDVSAESLDAPARAVERDVHDAVAREGEWIRPSFFEVLVLVALRLFAERRVDVMICEGGIGGASDPVSLIPGDLAILTSIAMDHAEALGGSLASIAADKAGMASDGATLVLGPEIGPELRSIVEAETQPRGVALRRATIDGIHAIHAGLRPTAIELAGRDLRFDLPLLGRHQIDNLATVIEAISALREMGVVKSDRCLSGASDARWPGRLEVRAGAPSFVLDVAHNEHGIRALAASIDDLAPARDRVLLYGAAEGKDYRACLPHLPRLAPAMYLVEGFHRAIDARSIAAELPEACKLLGAFSSIPEAVRSLRASAIAPVILATGSLYMVGELGAHLDETSEK